MKLRLTTDRTDAGREQREGDVIDASAAEGRRLLNARQAELITDSPVETAIETAAEQIPAAKPRSHRGRAGRIENRGVRS